MKYTGNQDFNLNQIINVKLEMFATRPAYDPSFLGRMIFINDNGNPHFGINVGGPSGWILINDPAALTFLANLSDVQITSPVNGNNLTYLSAINKWVNAPGSGSGLSMKLDEPTIVTQNVLPNLSMVPLHSSSVMLLYQGQLRLLGTDYTVTGPTNQNINWISPYFNVSPGDFVSYYYPTVSTAGTPRLEVVGVPALNTLDPLDFSPINPSALMLYVNGQQRRSGVDYTLSGTTLTWISPTLPLLSTYVVQVFYVH